MGLIAKSLIIIIVLVCSFKFCMACRGCSDLYLDLAALSSTNFKHI